MYRSVYMRVSHSVSPSIIWYWSKGGDARGREVNDGRGNFIPAQ